MKEFTLNPSGDGAHARASRAALFAYAEAIRDEDPELAKQLTIAADRSILSILRGNFG